ncbi:flagellar protein FlaG [Brevibacillus fluminis]|uniref:Flagellar protein FlaG n=1 Tax=Brevibacillus fluminis TaxID=511487 RepID=A0A3M8DX28_9BACL|nr:flagellar protein FlaG [Brevibacillus fluminis]RNB92642.1 flagellar protein FlaG [Brevibacillus fluminis]
MNVQSVNQIGRASVSSTERAESVGVNLPGSGSTGKIPYVSPSAQQEQSEEELNKAVDSLNKWMDNNGTHLSFKLHDKLNEYYVQVVDNQTEEIIREIPSKKILDIFAEMQHMVGLLVDRKI